jgi:hypothetical protein
VSSTRSLLDVVTPRRLITLALLLSAVVLSVVGLQSVKDTRAATCSHGVILKLYPCPGDTDLRQGTIGVDMASGWQADLYLDNNAIPKDQLVITGSSYYYTPGENGAPTLSAGAHTARVAYYRTLADEATAQQFAWNFRTS